jgi:uncharacterized membrane protein YdjX (TVP38/TMEM64 family)
MRQLKRYVPILLILLLSVLAWFLGIYHALNFETLKALQKPLELFIEQHHILSILIYSGLYMVIAVLSIPVATFMTIVGGFLLGQWIGTAATVISATLGATLLFLCAQLALIDLPRLWIKKLKTGFQKNAFSYLITLRLIPLFPFAVVNLVAAIFQLPLHTFFFGTLIGIIPGSFVYVSIGVALKKVIQKSDFTVNIMLDPNILLAFIGLGILSLLPILYQYSQRSHSR